MTTGQTTNVLICGVGGQGVLLASEILSHAALAAGLDVKKSEVHGMSQRGGSVESHVRFGPQIHSPLIALGGADVLLGFEPMETLRFAHYVSPKGTVIVSTDRVVPPSIREDQYPTEIEAKLKSRAGRVIALPTLAIANELGNAKVVNVLLLGVLSALVGLPQTAWNQALEARVPAKARELNLRAFERGRTLAA